MCLPWIYRLRKLRRKDDGQAEKTNASCYDDDAYPTFPPLPPEELFNNRSTQLRAINMRQFGAPRGIFQDDSLFHLYRIYEQIMLDNRFGYRNLLEQFWCEHQWPLEEIKDPQDTDPARYACLAATTCLMRESYNAKIKIGATRDSDPLMSPEEAEKARNRPESDKDYENIPRWAEKVAPLPQPLFIPSEDGTIITNPQDQRLNKDFLEKNVFLWTPHIYFT